MQPLGILILCILVCIGVGIFIGYCSPPNRDARKAFREKREADLAGQRKLEAEGRRKNAENIARAQFLELLGEVFNNPHAIRGRFRGAESILRFFEEHHKLLCTHRDADLVEERQRNQAQAMKDIRGQLKEVQAALKLGQPVE